MVEVKCILDGGIVTVGEGIEWSISDAGDLFINDEDGLLIMTFAAGQWVCVQVVR